MNKIKQIVIPRHTVASIWDKIANWVTLLCIVLIFLALAAFFRSWFQEGRGSPTGAVVAKQTVPAVLSNPTLSSLTPTKNSAPPVAPTSTPAPPTNTPQPTQTPMAVKPTNSPTTVTLAPTHTATAIPTFTRVPPTSTPVPPTKTSVPTNTKIPTPTRIPPSPTPTLYPVGTNIQTQQICNGSNTIGVDSPDLERCKVYGVAVDGTIYYFLWFDNTLWVRITPDPGGPYSNWTRYSDIKKLK